jgi:hypothetical protein
MALSSIKRAAGMIDGRGLAIGGLVTGYISLVFGAIFGIAFAAGLSAPVILKQRQAADRTEKISHMMAVSQAFIDFKAKTGSFPADALAQSKPEFSGMRGSKVLEQLEAAGTITDLEAKLAVRKVYAGDWLYFTGPDAGSPSSEPLLMSPPIGMKRLVIYRDGAVKQESTPHAESLMMEPNVKIHSPVKR